MAKIRQTKAGLNSSNPSSVQSLDKLNASAQSTATSVYVNQLEHLKNSLSDLITPLQKQTKPLSSVVTTVKKTKVVRSASGDGSGPSAKPVVVNNKNVGLQSGLGLNDIVDVVIPYARSATINFVANKLKPNTKYYAFFNEYDVTDYCYTGNSTANVMGFSTTYMTSKLESQKLANVAGSNEANVIVSEIGNIYSDYKGFVSGNFVFNPEVGLKIPSGKIIFRLTDSPTNGDDKESYADAVYVSNGRLSRTTPTRPVADPKKPTYGSGGGVKNPSIKTPGKGNSGTKPEDVDYGYIDYMISVNKGIPLSSITNELRVKTLADFSKTTGGSVITDSNQLKTITPGAVNYGIYEERTSKPYNFVSGKSLSPTLQNTRLSDGTRLGDYGTAFNVLEAVNPNTGRTLVQDIEAKIKAVGGQKAWDLALGTYEGVVIQVQQNLKNGTLTQDQKIFWEAGMKSGSFNPNNPADIDKAIRNYAAKNAMAYFEQKTPMAIKAGAAVALNGTAPSLKNPKPTKNNSIPTSTNKK